MPNPFLPYVIALVVVVVDAVVVVWIEDLRPLTNMSAKERGE